MNPEYSNRIDLMNDKVDAAIKVPGRACKEKFVNALKQPTKSVVIYSAYRMEDDDKLPIDNLDDIAFEGTFTVIGDYDAFWDRHSSRNGQTYKSEPITNPTWLELTVIANDCILCTNDLHHIFFEGADRLHGKDKDKNTLRLFFGS